jgi:hypothetical protein
MARNRRAVEMAPAEARRVMRFCDSQNADHCLEQNCRTAKTARGEKSAVRRLAGRPVSQSQNAGADLDRYPKKIIRNYS